MKLWGGRFSESLDRAMARLNDLLPFDQRLAVVDVEGSIAWAKALARAGVINDAELFAIIGGLTSILNEFEKEAFAFEESDEDIHTAVERRLGELIGEVAGKLHTGRSRNDQVATDFCLWIRKTSVSLEKELVALQTTLVERAEKDLGVILPGYTHFQQAQPILLSHWWLAHFWALERDRSRLGWVREGVMSMPLGSAALAGTTLEIDRFKLAVDLGFHSSFAEQPGRDCKS